MSGPFADARAGLIATREAFISVNAAIQGAQIALERAATRFQAVYQGVGLPGRLAPQRIGMARKQLAETVGVVTSVIESLNDEIMRF